MTSVASRQQIVASPLPAAERDYAVFARAWWCTLALVAGITLARVLYLALFCPYTLVEDEAHYWEWSRHLAWSYYSKGPGVAWTIAASTWLGRTLGFPLSEFWVRLPAAISGGVLLLGVAGLTRSITRDNRAAFLSAICILLIPAFQASSLLMTIDVPYAACWAMAAWAAFLALRRGSASAWLALGAAVGLGFLFKYTILLLIPGIATYAVVQSTNLNLAPNWRPRAAAGAAIFALALIPVVLWNAQHDWPTVRHLLGHLGLAGGDTPVRQGGAQGWHWSPKWVLSFLAAQLALVGPVLILMGWSLARVRELRHTDCPAAAELSFLIHCAAPVLLFYVLVSLLTEPEGNWPLAGYITLAALCGWGVLRLQEQWRSLAAAGKLSRNWLLGTAGTPARLAWRTALVFGIIAGLALLRADLVATSLPMRAFERTLRSAGLYTSERPIVPIGRLMGANRVAAHAARLQQQVASETGPMPIVIAQQYGRASQLAFYMPGRPLVYCSSAKSGGRKTQYDLWPRTNLDSPSLRGVAAICVGGHPYQWEPAFERIVEFGMLDGEPKASRLTFVGYGYRGFSK
jgi:4-amino-4-deoxy-L-arabinose transferase-like glycosyltransferase